MPSTGDRASTACPLDCPDACSLRVTLGDDRVVALDGDRRNPLTQGFICAKVRRFARHMYGEERLLHPAIRTGPKGEGRFEPVSWNHALDLVAQRIREAVDEHGSESVLPFSYGGSNGLLTEGTVDRRFFWRLGASRLRRTVCAAPTGRAAQGLYGRMPGVALTDYRHAELIVLWGFNPSVSGIHLVPIINDALASGARLVVVDPRRIQVAGKAALHLSPRPGTDLPIALGLIRFLFENGRADLPFLREHATGWEELRRRALPWTFDRVAAESGVPVEDLEQFARLYADTSPAVVRCGWGLERNRNGGSAAAAVLALPAVAGKFGMPGGGFTTSNSRSFRLEASGAVAAEPSATREINMNQLGRALTELDDPPVAALFVYDCNPAATMPHQSLVRRGLARTDLFTVVFDQVMTDTARYADVLLPATTFLEHHDLATGYGAIVLNRIRPVVQPVGQARPNYTVFTQLCRRLELSRPGDPETPEALVEAILHEHPDRNALQSALDSDGLAHRAPIPFVDVFPWTSDAKIHLCPAELDTESPGGLYRHQPDLGSAAFPLALISPAQARTTSSTFAQLLEGPAPVAIHPDDAAARGIAGGDPVRIFNRQGEVRTRARVTDEVRPGVVSLPKGLWNRHTLDGNTANTLVPDTLTDLGGGATFNDARVEIEREGR